MRSRATRSTGRWKNDTLRADLLLDNGLTPPILLAPHRLERSDMSSARLEGKRALVTAAAQGIGRATAEPFAAECADVLDTAVNLAALESLAGCRTASLDVCDPDEIAHVVRQAGDIDILFNCAGWVANGTILDCTEADWDRSFELNVKSMYRMIRAV